MFFSNSGSEAVDSALKIALAYHQARGEPQRTRFVGRLRGYHGVGFGGISVGGIEMNKKAFAAQLLPQVDHLPHTHDLAHNAFTKGQPSWGAHLADALEGLVAERGAGTIAAVIVEPMAGSTGVLIPPKGYLEKLRALCDRHGILLIFDEVITGFGRLGSPFAAQHFGVIPDMLTVAKGITNAAVPMGATCVKGTIYDAVVDATEKGIEFFHGYTYSGHPLAAAAGLATLDLYAAEGIFARAAAMAPAWEAAMHSLRDAPHVIDVRNMGLVAGIELESRAGAPGMRALRRVRGLLLQPEPADPDDGRHHRAVAAADHQRGADRGAGGAAAPRAGGGELSSSVILIVRAGASISPAHGTRPTGAQAFCRRPKRRMRSRSSG